MRRWTLTAGLLIAVAGCREHRSRDLDPRPGDFDLPTPVHYLPSGDPTTPTSDPEPSGLIHLSVQGIVDVPPGGSAPLRVQIERLGFDGPVTISLSECSSVVSAGSVVLAPGETAGVLSVGADSSASNPQGAPCDVVATGPGRVGEWSAPSWLRVGWKPGSYSGGGAIAMSPWSRAVPGPHGTAYFIDTYPIWVGSLFQSELIVERRDADGSLDSAFGESGALRFEGSEANVLVSEDESFLLELHSGGSTTWMRFLPDGTQDSSFGVDGALHFSGDVDAFRISSSEVDAVSGDDGDLGLTGFDFAGEALWSRSFGHLWAHDIGEDGRLYGLPQPNVMTAFLPSGDPDPGFGTEGSVSFPEQGLDVVASKSGPLVFGITYADLSLETILTVRRFRNDGSLDDAFGSHGVTSTGVHPDAVALDGIGRIVIAGSRDRDWQPSVIRLLPDGSRDDSLTTPAGLDPDHFICMAVLSDDRVVVGSLGVFVVAP